LYGVALNDPALFYYQEQLKVTPHSEIVVKLTADNAKNMSVEYGTEVRDVVAFYHWHFTEVQDSTLIAIRSYCNIRADKRPDEKIITDLVALFHLSWNKCLDKLQEIACSPAKLTESCFSPISPPLIRPWPREDRGAVPCHNCVAFSTD
jgi:hypothetical protein